MFEGLSDEQFALLLVTPLILFAVIIVAFPMGYSIWISMEQVNWLTRQTSFVGVQNYFDAFRDPYFVQYFAVTLRFTAEVTVLVLMISIGAALLLNEAFPGRFLVRVIAVLPWAISEYCTAVVWRYLYSSEIGLFNGILYELGIIGKYVDFLSAQTAVEATAVAYAWRYAPFITMFVLAGLQIIPRDLYRAAKMDGAGPFRRVWDVTFPHIRYALLIGVILTTLEAARATDIFIILTGGGPAMATESVTYHIFRTTFRGLDLGLGAAFSWLLMALTMSITVIYFVVLTRRR